jgi:hypothetical protein
MSLSPQVFDLVSAISHAADVKNRTTDELVQHYKTIDLFRRNGVEDEDAKTLLLVEAMLEGELYERDQLDRIGKRADELGF